jgi:RHS repeat-associated protein
MKRIIALSAFLLSFIITTSVSAQSLGSSGGLCAGSYIDIYINGGSYPCGGGNVTSQGNWYISPTPTSVTYFQNSGGYYNSIRVMWNTAVSATVRASYTCSDSGNPGQTSDLNLTIGAVVTPTVSLTTTTNICVGSNVTFTASPTNGGGTPTFRYYVDNDPNPVYTGTSSIFNYSTAGLSAGNHTVYATMNTSLFCYTTSSATSSTQTFTVNAKSNYTAQMNGPGLICGGTTSIHLVTTVTPMLGTLSYKWFVNGAPSWGTNSLDVTVNEGTQIYCEVYSDASCVNSPATTSTYTIHVTASVTPTASVQYSTPTVCSGQQITFTANSPYLSGSSTYVWTLNGSVVSAASNAQSITLTSSYASQPGYYSPGSSVAVTINGLSGTCLATTSASGTAGSVTVNPIPHASLSNLPPSNTVCSGTPISVNIFEQDGLGSTTWSYSATPSNANGSAGGTTSPIAQTLSSADGLNNGSVAYSIIPTRASCPGPAVNFTITVKPKPVITNTTAQLQPSPFCSGTALNFTPSSNIVGTTYTWTSSISGTIDAATVTGSGSGAITNSPVNTGNNTASVTYIITPTLNTCAGTAANYVAPFYPKPTVAASPASRSVCSGQESTNITLSNPNGVPGTTYSWTINQPSLPGGSDGSGSLINQTLVNGASANVTATYTVTARANNCNSTPLDVIITVKPIPNVAAASDAICSGQTTAVTISNPNGVGGTTFSWLVTQANVSGASNGSGTLISQALTNVSQAADGTATYAITPMAAGCSGTAVNSVITVRPTPVISSSAGTTIGYGNTTTLSVVNYPTYQWTKESTDILGATSQTLVVNQTGTYGIRVTSPSQVCLAGSFILKDAITSQNENYIMTTTYLSEGFTASSDMHTAGVDKYSISTTYFDGLGRPMQSVTTKGSPLKNDIVQPMIYDQYGRSKRQYLPFVPNANTGVYISNSTILDVTPANGDYIGVAATFYNNPANAIADDGNKPFSETVFEPSPLNRTLERGAPGLEWQPDGVDSYTSNDYTVKMAYETNVANEVIQWSYSNAFTTYPFGVIASGASWTVKYYDPNQLYKTKTKDEHKNEVIEYKDIQGRVVLKRVQAVSGSPSVDDTNYASTYYIYDDFGNLVCVISPEATKRIVSEYLNAPNDAAREAFLGRWAFRYRYDLRNRMILKQAGGSDSVRMVYDVRDRLVLSQDGNQRLNKLWSYTKYDIFNRPILTGQYTHTIDLRQAQMLALLSTSTISEKFDVTATTTHGYTNTVFPAGNFPGTFDVLTVTYYDDYAFKPLLNNTNFNYANNELPATNLYKGQEGAEYLRVRSMVTGAKIKVLDNSGTYLWSVNYYDNKYRVIQTTTSTFKVGSATGFDRTTNVYDFAGKVLRSKVFHSITGHPDRKIVQRFSYDHVGRLMKAWHMIEGTAEVLMSANQYNELGQLITKKLHQTSQSGTAKVADSSVGLPGTSYSANIVSNSYSTSQNTYVASSTIRLLPGFATGANNSFYGRIGLSSDDANAYNDALTGTFLQAIDYRYNVRGWLRLINDPAAPIDDDLFNMELKYNSPTANGGTAQYNGNISEAIWKSAGLDKQTYGYNYDPMNRMLTANYVNITKPIENGKYNEQIGAGGSRSAYDLNGNILNVLRYGKIDASGTLGLMDDLTYDYANGGWGNQLKAVTDAHSVNIAEEGFKDIAGSQDYAYDKNGNIVRDANKGIAQDAIQYNYLNLPIKVSKNATDYVTYTYDATGRKLAQQVFGASAKTTDYISELVLENNVLQLILTSEGRIIPDNSVGAPDPWEYQYFLKDHLGNTRVVFSEKKATTTYAATLEDNTLSSESATFRKYPTGGARSPLNIFDHTDAGTTYTYSHLLNGGNNSQVGLAKSFTVNPGDVFDLEVYAKYEATTGPGNNVNALLTQLTSAFSLGANTSPIDGSAAQSAFGNLFTGGGPYINATNWDATAPKAYLNYILFNEAFTLIDFGFDQISTAGEQVGVSPVTPHDYLSLHVKVKQKGYLYVYLSNEQSTPVNVYFDDLKIVQYNAVQQIADYYPFGLTFKSFQVDGSTPNSYLYNGKEKQDELDLGWLDYGARMYMPELGRWGVIDPLGEYYLSWSPYCYALDNPAVYNDIEGAGVGDPKYTGSGSVVIIIADRADDISEGYWDTSTLDNTAWDYGVFNSLTEASEWIEGTYGKDGKKIHDLVIRSHGFVGDSPERHAINVQGTDKQFIRAEDLEAGRGKNIRALANIANHLAPLAKVLFTACGASQNGTMLAEALFRRLSGVKKKLEIFTNGSNTKLQDKGGIKIRKHLNEKENQWTWRPWTSTTSNGSTSLENSVPMLGANGLILPVAQPTTGSDKSKPKQTYFEGGKGRGER